ncbi:cytochrome P450 [Pleurotus eryngii]|uniref:Cytochrome P450 n=1 Tax=Pleurotus eryngii TaxID=5323 RepID=A0A9P6DKM0_PLEER|nr:cytochrome P450 [Pleurotus eryngii]
MPNLHGADEQSSFLFINACIIIAVSAFIYRKSRQIEAELAAIPTIGWTFPPLSYITAIIYTFDANRLIHEGYVKYPEGVYKIAGLTGWNIFVRDKRLIEEMRMHSNNELSLGDAAIDLVTTSHTFSLDSDPLHNTYKRELVEMRLTRTLIDLVPLAHEEITQYFAAQEPLLGDNKEWATFSPLDMSVDITTLVWSRVLGGLSLSQNQKFIASFRSLLRITLSMPLLARCLPRTLVRLIYRMLFRLKISAHLKSLLDGKDVSESRSLPEGQNICSWMLLDEFKPSSIDVLEMIEVLALSGVSSLTSVFAEILHHLAKHRNYNEFLHEEVRKITRMDGWSRNAIEEMSFVDSFVKESMRRENIRSASMMRKVVKPFAFSNGLQIPVGTIISVPSRSVHMDPERYSRPNDFEGFRFVTYEENLPTTSIQDMLISTNSDFFVWGHGREACPGRFFAATVLKLLVAYIVSHYDVQLPRGKERSRKPRWIEGNLVSDFRSKIMLRKRQRH